MQVTIPIFSGGSVYYRQVEAEHVTEQYRNRLREVEEQLGTDHREALSALESVGSASARCSSRCRPRGSRTIRR